MTEKTNDVLASLIGLETAEVTVNGETFVLTSLVPSDVQKATKASVKRNKLDEQLFRNTMLAMSLRAVHGEQDPMSFARDDVPIKHVQVLMKAMDELNGFDVMMKEAIEDMKEREDADSEDE